MKLAPIVPPGCEYLLPPGIRRVMAFADIAAVNPDYADFYRALRGATRVVMDNQIFEGQQGLAKGDLANVLAYVRPHVAIIPDVRGETDATLAKAVEYTNYFALLGGLDGVNLCGVVQGRRWDENVRCLETYKELGLQYVAVPIRVPGATMSRWEVYAQCVRPRLLPDMKVHFLGMEGTPPYFIEADGATDPFIESLDTAEPTNAAIWGALLSYLRSGRFTRRPPDFMSAPAYRPILEERKDLLWSNIRWLQDRLAMPQASEGTEIRPME